MQSVIRLNQKSLYKTKGESKKGDKEEENKKRKNNENPQYNKELKKISKKEKEEEKKSGKMDLEKAEDLENCSKENLIKCLAKKIKANRRERE